MPLAAVPFRDGFTPSDNLAVVDDQFVNTARQPLSHGVPFCSIPECNVLDLGISDGFEATPHNEASVERHYGAHDASDSCSCSTEAIPPGLGGRRRVSRAYDEGGNKE